jgi:hypothetical protein
LLRSGGTRLPRHVGSCKYNHGYTIRVTKFGKVSPVWPV